MKSLELFAGIGGIALAAEWAGIETVAFCERDPFCQKILNKHWPNVPIFDDVENLNKQTLEDRGVDVGTIELISGGFPCQPFSTLGKRKGTKDDRDLWPEMFRIIQEIKPHWIVGENVANFAFMELQRTLTDLESVGYETEVFLIPACSQDVRHRRDRTFIVANSMCSILSTEQESEYKNMGRGQNTLAHGKEQFMARWSQGRNGRKVESGIRRGNDGISNRMDSDRLKRLGNAVVPQQIYPIFESIMKLEESNGIIK